MLRCDACAQLRQTTRESWCCNDSCKIDNLEACKRALSTGLRAAGPPASRLVLVCHIMHLVQCDVCVLFSMLALPELLCRPANSAGLFIHMDLPIAAFLHCRAPLLWPFMASNSPPLNLRPTHVVVQGYPALTRGSLRHGGGSSVHLYSDRFSSHWHDGNWTPACADPYPRSTFSLGNLSPRRLGQWCYRHEKQLCVVGIDHRFLRFHPVLLRQEHIDKCCLQALRSRNTFCKSPIDRDTEMRGSFGPDFGCCFGNALRQCGGNQWVVENAVLEKVLRLQRVGVTL